MREPYGFKEFKVKEIMNVSRGNDITKKELSKIEGGDVRYIKARRTNNGIETYVDIEPQEDLAITISDVGTMGVVFLQNRPFYASGNNTYAVMKEVEDTENKLLYMGSVINKRFQHLEGTYGRLGLGKLRDTKVLIPITSEGTPDYVYMEDYIDHIKGEYVDKLEESHREEYHQLEALGLDEGAIELEEPYGYEEFELDNMFERVQTGYIGEGSYQENSQEEKTEEFSLPLLSAKYDNNGILFYGRPEEWRTYRNVLGVVTSGAVAAGLVYAYKDYVSVRSTAYLLKMKNKEYKDNFKVLQYLATALEKTLFGRYTRDYAPIWGRVLGNKEKIKLPSTPEGTPDYEYMENYIKHIAYTYRMNRRDEQEEEVRQLRELVQ